MWSPAHPALAEYFGALTARRACSRSTSCSTEPDVSVGAVAPEVKGDTLASLIFTSGTTGTPKGVMLTHKNFTSMASKLSALFTLYKHDKLLSVLPLHHTFEFSAGFLMPLIHGASIDYLEEIDADSLARALEDEGITGMVGVPALWQLLERKIYKNVSEAGVLVEKAFDSIVDLNRSLREKLPWDLATGKLLFFPVHQASSAAGCGCSSAAARRCPPRR